MDIKRTSASIAAQRGIRSDKLARSNEWKKTRLHKKVLQKVHQSAHTRDASNFQFASFFLLLAASKMGDENGSGSRCGYRYGNAVVHFNLPK